MNLPATLPYERRHPLYERIWSTAMYDGWHWLQWNFDLVRTTGQEALFAVLVLDALARCDDAMPGFADEMVDRLALLGGQDRNRDDYERIRQWLGELLVIHHLVTWPWPNPVAFEHEPAAKPGGPNPEIMVTLPDVRLGVEVKTPDLRDHRLARASNADQLLARLPQSAAPGGGAVTLPRDNPIKDFLVSAERKFEDFRAADEAFRSVLFIVWDDYVNEPISALASPASGLFMQDSFHPDPGGKRYRYPATDAVVILRHQHQFVEGMANRPAVDERLHMLDYGELGRFPPAALLPCPDGKELPGVVGDALQAAVPHPTMGAEYIPAERVMWITT